jgi:hypothetical protein
MRERWGSMLASAPAREEVRLHGRRMAMLNRALLLAQTEAKPSDQDRLIQRIEGLIARENTRHERAMANLKSMPPGKTVAANNPGATGASEPGSMPGSKPATGNPPNSGNNPSAANANPASAPAMGTKGAEK